MYTHTSFLLVAYAVLSQYNVQAQKHDYIWHFGYNYNSSTPEAEAFNLNFDTFPPRMELEERDMYIINGYSNICDSMGDKLFLSNNCRIVNRNGANLINGDSMVQDWELDYCNNYGWHPTNFTVHFSLHRATQTRFITSINQQWFVKKSASPI